MSFETSRGSQWGLCQDEGLALTPGGSWPQWHCLRKELPYHCCLASPPAAAFRLFTVKQHFASKNTQGDEGA